MTKKWYGNVTNRIEEGRNYNKDKQIHLGDDITKYHWSDRTCYYVTEVIDQKHIKVKRYYVCADHSKEGGMGHQDWVYFKTKKEEDDYLKKYIHDYKFEENSDIELVYRYGKWKEVSTYTDLNATNDFGVPFKDFLFTKNDIKKLEEGKPVYKYNDFGNISFGVKDFYYDWSF